MTKIFNHSEAFSRNLGCITKYEQLKLKESRVAITGLGGVGGLYFINCVRIGIEKFNLAEFDQFELGNFNRQVGANMETIGRKKLDAMIEQALAINPNLQINSFPKGVNKENITDFLDDCDVYLDGLDLFAMPARRLVFQECKKHKIPAITCGPIVMGFAQLVFTHNNISFDDFFDFNTYPEEYQSLLFILGLTPNLIHRDSIYDVSRINFTEQKVSSTYMGCQFCSGSVVTEAVKYILDRGNKIQAPYGIQYDAHSNIFNKSHLRWGNKGPLQKIKISLALKEIKSQQPHPYSVNEKLQKQFGSIVEIAEYAKWSPSINNAQPWNVEIISSKEIAVKMDSNSLDNKLANLEFGIYFESIRQLSTVHGLKAEWSKTDTELLYSIKFKNDKSSIPENTAEYIEARFTDRRAYKCKKMTEQQTKTLQELASQSGYEISIQESMFSKLGHAALNAINLWSSKKQNAFLESVDASAPFSNNKIPLKSYSFSSYIGIKVMKTRYLLTKILLFPFAIIIQILSPANFSNSGNLLLSRSKNFKALDENNAKILDGQIIQRLWLKATALGLVMHPNYTTLLAYKKDNIKRKNHVFLGSIKRSINSLFGKLLNIDSEEIIFIARIGEPKSRKIDSRSTRINKLK